MLMIFSWFERMNSHTGAEVTPRPWIMGSSAESWAMCESMTLLFRVSEDSFFGCKTLFLSKHDEISLKNKSLQIFVPAAAVIREGQALFGFIGRKAFSGGSISWKWNPSALHWICFQNSWTWAGLRTMECMVEK